ncbi:CDP-alcohol phosphatidyltransferase family protein [Streptomyces sp. NRRL S-1824]|uniref:CDP-alcohol phosphatidyltransferase family protein n=1 Tax=Streptomyces sp. NRRL S-1824 TaxID=1463889 RepID=UPI0004CB8BFE|nr:CDP-alcohol phosphatidyltransferase family protein [Streptomyces sp. NRRL S-1824]
MRRDIPPLVEVRRITQKKRDAWWTVLLVDPVATPLVRFVARRTRITPNQITWGALILGLVAAACFVKGDWYWLIAGALLYHLSFILDCMDGKVARLTGQGSVFGAWLDYIFDRIRVMACAVALMAGQYYRTGEMIYVWLAAVVVFLDGLRYINSLEIFKTRHTMRKQIKSRIRSARRDENQAELAFMEDLLRDNPEADIDHDATTAAAQEEAISAPVTLAASRGQVIDLQQEFRHRFPGYLRFRSFMLRHRIRTHLISGIEFQMSVFIIGPLLDQIIGATIVSAALLLVFELAIVYKLLLSTRDFTRTMNSFEQQQQNVTTAA